MQDNGWIQQAIARLSAVKQGLDSAVVRIGFMGETGSGKSSLVNDIVGWKVLPVGATGETTTVPLEVR